MKELLIAVSFLFVSTAHAGRFPGESIVDWVFGTGSFGRPSSPIADKDNCVVRYLKSQRFANDTTWVLRKVPERSPLFEDDLSFLEEQNLVRNRLGVLDSKYVPEFDTRIYYSVTGKPEPDGSIPMVDPEAPALFIYFHGSGTKAANGGTGSIKMNKLAEMGFANLSIDLPFHGDGTRDPSKTDPEVFAKYIKSIVDKYRRPGQKVVLWGHSYGPDVIFELLTRYPEIADAVVGFSPGSFDKATTKFYTENTARMAESWANVEKNEDGAHWATTLGENLAWKDLRLRKLYGLGDPTVKSKAKVIVVSGDREEFIPGPLLPNGSPADAPRSYDIRPTFKKYFANAEVVIEPGAGHLIFNHVDANGHDVMLRELLRSVGHDIAEEPELRKQAGARKAREIDRVATLYAREPFFKNWFDGTFGKDALQKALAEESPVVGNKILTAWKSFEADRTKNVLEHVSATQSWAPKFYADNRELIDAIGSKGYDSKPILIAYRKFLSELPYSERKAHAQTRSPEYTQIDLASLTAKKDTSSVESIEQAIADAKSNSPQARAEAAKALGKAFMVQFGSITNKYIDSVAREVASTRGGSAWSALQDFRSKDAAKSEPAAYEIFDLFLRKLSASRDQLTPGQVDLLNRLQLGEGFLRNTETYQEIQSTVVRMSGRLPELVKKYEAEATSSSLAEKALNPDNPARNPSSVPSFDDSDHLYRSAMARAIYILP